MTTITMAAANDVCELRQAGLLSPSPPAEKATAREISSCRSASETRSSASTIQLIRSSLAKGFNFFSSVETRSRNSFMTL